MKIVEENMLTTCKRSSVNRMAAGLRRSSHGFFLLSPTFPTFQACILSEVNINILGLYKAFCYTGSALTKYFNHNESYVDSCYPHKRSHFACGKNNSCTSTLTER